MTSTFGSSVFLVPALPGESRESGTSGVCPVLYGMTRSGRVLPAALIRHRYGFAGASLALLLAATVFLGVSDATTATARRALAKAQARLDEARQLEVVAARDAARSVLTATLARQARAAGFVPGDWDERRFNMRQAVMGRDAVNALLDEITRRPGRLFAAEQFEVSVKRPEDGLFSRPREGEADLLVTLRGNLVYRAARTPQ